MGIFYPCPILLDTAASEPLDLLQLLLEASLVVRLVLVLLIVLAAACWFITGAKYVRLSQAVTASKAFLARFWDHEPAHAWDANRLEGIYTELDQHHRTPLASLFRAGYVELARITADASKARADSENVERAVQRAKNNEFVRLENALPVLATTGSIGPFVGLFGTVWGIMNTFIAIHGNKNVNLHVVLPGIAEALVATAIGLAAAIPAVVAYNYFIRRIRVLESEADAFGLDLINIVRRHFLSR